VTHSPAKYRACAVDTHDRLPSDDHRATAKVMHRTRAASKRRIKAVDPAAVVQAWEASGTVMPRNEVTMLASKRLQAVQSSKWALLDTLEAHECLESQRAERAARATACREMRGALDQQMEVWRLLRIEGCPQLYMRHADRGHLHDLCRLRSEFGCCLLSLQNGPSKKRLHNRPRHPLVQEARNKEREEEAEKVRDGAAVASAIAKYEQETQAVAAARRARHAKLKLDSEQQLTAFRHASRSCCMYSACKSSQLCAMCAQRASPAWLWRWAADPIDW
jgi:hypothetical protein